MSAYCLLSADSVRAFKERNKLGRFKEVSPEEQQRLDEEKKLKEQKEMEKAESMKIGDRYSLALKLYSSLHYESHLIILIFVCLFTLN